MDKHLKITVDLPPYPAVVQAWTKRAGEAAERGERFYKFANYFFNRSVYDCRLPDGGFYDGPLRHKVCFGTREEWDKGFFLHVGEMDFINHWEQPFTMSTTLGGDFLSVPVENCCVDGHYLETDPAELAYQALVKAFGIEPATCAYSVGDHMGPEAVAFFFPLTKYREGQYILYQKNTRYGKEDYFLFEGNPEDFARVLKRNRRYIDEPRKDFYQIPLPEGYPELTGVPQCMVTLRNDGWTYTGNEDPESLKS